MREMSGVKADKPIGVHERSIRQFCAHKRYTARMRGFELGEREAAKMELNISPQESDTRGAGVRPHAPTCLSWAT